MGKTYAIPLSHVAAELRQCIRWAPERKSITARRGIAFVRAGSLAQAHRVFEAL